MLIVIAIIFIFLLLAAAGYYFYTKSSDSNNSTNESEEIQFIRLQRTDGKDEHINILEIELYDELGNKISTGITPIVSPQYGDANVFGPQFLIDGKATVNWGENSSGLPHTTNVKDAYMELKLNTPQVLSKVIIKNRLDCCKDRIIGTSLILKTSDGTEVFRLPITRGDDVFQVASSGGIWPKLS